MHGTLPPKPHILRQSGAYADRQLYVFIIAAILDSFFYVTFKRNLEVIIISTDKKASQEGNHPSAGQNILRLLHNLNEVH
jgi:hypothetical protein